MVTTDPIADMLTRIRNATAVYKPNVCIPASKMKLAIADILMKNGYISSFEILNTTKQGTIKVYLKYINGKSSIIGLRRISKPGCRCYSERKTLPRVLKGYGICIVSTSKGLMTDKNARLLNVGGEVVAFVW